MKRLLLILLCLCLTGCTYLGATEDILISSPDEIEVSQLSTNEKTPAQDIPPETTEASTTTNSTTEKTPETTVPVIEHLILNTSSKKIHYFDNCSYANRMDPKNRKVVDVSSEKSLLTEEYTVCSWCAKQRG